MKKTIFRVLLFALTLLSVAGCMSEDRRMSLLKVYNWGDYIDEDLLGEFEEWYLEQTGEEVEVIYQTFDINETMLSKIEKGHEDFDLVCPSDYIVERMLRGGLLLPIEHDFGDTPDYIETNVSPYMKHLFSLVDAGEGVDANDYAVPYMWGTTGFLYNERYVDAQDVRSWNVLKNDKYIDKIFVKDAARDVYSPILMYLRRDEIASGEVTREALMYDSSDKSLSDVEEYMSEMRHRVAGWEADFGKEQMTQERGWLNFTWSGDAVWAIMEADELGVPLKYTVPDEGSNVWFDAWVIPKYARNVKAARYFINFLCSSENAIRNMDYIGYVSSIGTREVFDAMNSEEDNPETVDAAYFFPTVPEASCAHLDPAQYFDFSVISRCTMMHDWGDDSEKLIAMWSRVKGNQLSWWTIFVISTTAAAIIAAKLSEVLKQRRRRAARAAGRHRRK